ncbi:MAG: protein kinase [Planctomycetia bacterium]|nr:MAG: protein kinase [Planctomycetia bacterium]
MRYEPHLRISEYLLEEQLGRGAHGEVWRARHHIWSDQRVAIKLPVSPDALRFLHREGALVHGLLHPNIIRVLGLDPYASPPYLVMELIDGPSLRTIIEQHPRGMPLGATFAVLTGLLDGLHAAHDAGVIHRDLKPGNILLHLAGRSITAVTPADVRIGDFGFGGPAAAAADWVEQSASLARDDRILGTPAYLAPEVRDRRLPADERSDLFAVGVMMFELLTGSRPVGAELPGTLRPDVTSAVDSVFQRLYARHERRFASASDALRALRSAMLRPSPAVMAQPVEARRDFAVPPGSRPPSGWCLHCRRATPAGDSFCTRCGRPVHTALRTCSGCGAFPDPSDRYCIRCGGRLSDRTEGRSA